MRESICLDVCQRRKRVLSPELRVKLSFFPANLHLTRDSSGAYVVSVDDKTVARTKTEHAAVRKFQELRKAFEAKFPPSVPSTEDKRRAFLRELLDSQVEHNSFREPQKRPRGTRTFG
jgi:hypothetical protein